MSFFTENVETQRNSNQWSRTNSREATEKTTRWFFITNWVIVCGAVCVTHMHYQSSTQNVRIIGVQHGPQGFCEAEPDLATTATRCDDEGRSDPDSLPGGQPGPEHAFSTALLMV